MTKVAVIAMVALFTADTTAAEPLSMQESAGLRWECGGVGAGERSALAALEAHAKLKILFVTAKRGGYVADAVLSVHDTDSPTPRLKLTADGPICLLNAPAGSYRLHAAWGGAKRQKTVRLGDAIGKPLRVAFSFPGEPWDGIRASEEEKTQARSP